MLQRSLHILPFDNEEENVIILSLAMSPIQMAILSAVINHVPETFLDRDEIIMKICERSPIFEKMSTKTMMQIISTLQGCENLMNFYKGHQQNISEILWQASWYHKEPYLILINPPVDECLLCEEPLHPIARQAVTIYTFSGPLPGQKVVLKCKFCQIYYHIDEYRIPHHGKEIYPSDIICQWKSASSDVFLKTDLDHFLSKTR